jgi:hypothetical protein
LPRGEGLPVRHEPVRGQPVKDIGDFGRIPEGEAAYQHNAVLRYRHAQGFLVLFGPLDGVVAVFHGEHWWLAGLAFKVELDSG